jgi:hypothetical protein
MVQQYLLSAKGKKNKNNEDMKAKHYNIKKIHEPIELTIVNLKIT